MNTKHFLQVSCMAAFLCACSATRHPLPTNLSYGFEHPQDTARTKLWWFLGETETTREGITADLEAFKQQGVGGVVYYDQVHGKGEGADKVFSDAWWQGVIFSAQEARRLGLSFEANIGNGYVAGGKWITPEHSMQRLLMTELVATATPQGISVQLPLPRRPRDWHEDVAVLAVPYHVETLGDSKLLDVEPTGQPDSVLLFDFGQQFTARSITYEATPRGKARTSSMQVPPTHKPLAQPDHTRFYGCGFSELPPIGVLEVSDDNVSYQKVCDLCPKYRNFGGLRQQTLSFPAVRGRYFRFTLYRQPSAPVKLGEVIVSARARIDAWEEKVSLVSEYITSDRTPIYNTVEAISADSIVDLTGMMAADGTLTWPDAPAGEWLVMRFVSVSTGAHTKHGRADALGLECDKLSVEGARLHWQSYTKPLIDSIRAHGGSIEGICMDSHEAGPQNWTQDMPRQFARLRGYSLMQYLPTIAGGLWVANKDVLKDFRRTISDLITTNYYGEFNRLCHAEGLTLTAQAIGGALCMAGDHIEVKKLVDKPQGEFWGYQTEGNYDIKDCSSAAHVYGKPIASGEAFTDITYKHSLADIKNLADYAYAYGINEFVVCAVAYQPTLGEVGLLNTANGRQYVLNRKNTQWPLSREFWDYQARCSWMLRQGKPVADFCVYLGDNVPTKILSHLLPPIPQGYDFDAFTTDVLLHRMTVSDGRIVLPDGVGYSMLLLPANEELTPAALQKVEELRAAGIRVWNPRDGKPLTQALSEAGMVPDVDAPAAKSLYYCHRTTDREDIYFLNNHCDEAVDGQFTFRVKATSAELWNPVTGKRTLLPMTVENDRTVIDLTFAPRESYFIVLTNGQAPSNADSPSLQTSLRQTAAIPIAGKWMVKFCQAMGGPSEAVVFDELTDWTQHSDPRIRYYSGTAVYTNTFFLDKKDKKARYRLDMGQPGSVAQVFVNGQEAGTVWCSPWTLDVSPYVKKGKNQLEIRVANSLWNRLVGDAQKPEAERIMQQTTPLAKPSDRMMPSGLIGKVTLITLKAE